MTLTNTSAPGFPAIETWGNFTANKRELVFPELRLEQGIAERNWRFTEDVCLPPRVALADSFRMNHAIFSELAMAQEDALS